MTNAHVNPSSTRVKIDLIHMGNIEDCHILVQAKLAKQKITLIVDTGCTCTTIRSSIRHLGSPMEVELGTEQAYTVGGTIDDYRFVEVDSLVIGRLHLPPTRVALIEFPDVENLYREQFGITVDGLLGSDILNRYRAVISYARGTLTLYNPEE